MTTTSLAEAGAIGTDFLARTARALLISGLFMSPLLVARVAGFTVADMLILSSLPLAALSAATLAGNHLRTMRPLASQTMLLVGLIAIAISLANYRAVAPRASDAVGIRLIIVIVALPWVCHFLLTSAALLRRATNALILGGALSGSGCALQAAFGTTIIPGSEVTNAGRFPGFTQNVSDQGGIAALTFVLGAAALSNRNGFRTRVIGAAGLTGGGVGLILSGSVSGMLAALVGSVVLLARGLLTVRTVAVGSVLGIIVVQYSFATQAQFSALSPLDRAKQTLGLSAGGAYNTSESRLSTFEAAASGFFNHPIAGAGLDSASALADGVYPAHNILIGALYTGGLALGLAILVALVRPLRGVPRGVLPASLLAGGATAVAFSMTAPNPFSRYLWIPLALLLACKHLDSRAREDDQAATIDTSSQDLIPAAASLKAQNPDGWPSGGRPRRR